MKQFQVEMVGITTLIHPEYNPRILLDRVRADLHAELDEFGMVENIVVNRRNLHIVGGNQRVSVLREKGETQVPVCFVDLPLEAEKRLNLALNKIQGNWDDERLLALLEEVGLENTGFTEEEKTALLEDAEATEDEMESDDGLQEDFVPFQCGDLEGEIPVAIAENLISEIDRINKFLHPEDRVEAVSFISALEYMVANSATTPLRK